MLGEQFDLFGNRHRSFSWEAILTNKIQNIWNLRTDLSEVERNRLIISTTLVECFERIEVAEAIRAAPSLEMSYKILKAAFLHAKMPAMESLSRALRSAKVGLESLGHQIRGTENCKNGDDSNYDDLLVEISKSVTNRDSGLEHRFSVYLRTALPQIHFGHNEAIGNGSGQVLSVDFISRKYGIIVEIDGYEFHNDLHSFITDRQRWRTLTRWGYTVLPFAGTELTVPNGMENAIKEIKATIEKRISIPQ